VTGIEDCFSGDGDGDGCRLTYTYRVDTANLTSLLPDTGSVTVVYTLSP